MPISPEPPPTCPQPDTSPTFSIRQMARRYLLQMLLLVLLTATLIGALMTGVIERHQAALVSMQRTMVADDLSMMIGFYQSVVDNLSREQVVHDLLAFEDADEAQAWAEMVRHLLPGNIGLALVTGEGEVLGEPIVLRLGDSCLHDLHQGLSGEAVKQPPIHDEVEALAHFDVTSPVVDFDGEVIGLVFASFSLDLVGQRLKALGLRGGHLYVEGGNGEPIAEQGVPDERHADPDTWQPIAGSDWRLHVSLPGPDFGPLLWWTVASAAGLFTLLGLILVTFALRLGRVFTSDIHMVHDNLQRLQEGRGELTPPRPNLAETRSIMHSICRLIGEIESYQQCLAERSITDELTGLLNRRGFMQRAEQALALSQRGVPHTLLVIDLDHFKTCNDNHGHALGDQVLKAFARALRKRARGSDLCARIGGDEFAVILAANESDSLHSWFAEVTRAFRSEQLGMPVESPLVRLCGCSAGAVAMTGAVALDDLLVVADSRLYRAKGSGRACLIES